MAQPRSDLQRVAYGVSDGTLQRLSWAVLDRVPGSEPRSLPLLDGVEALNWRFLDVSHEWIDTWPPAAGGGVSPERLPLAIEMTLELEEWGTIRRLVRIPQGGNP
jgi:general secretion pathway protein J